MASSFNEDNVRGIKYNDIVKAVGYWVVLNDLREFFKNAEMGNVHNNLSNACDEIDRIWREYEGSNM